MIQVFGRRFFCHLSLLLIGFVPTASLASDLKHLGDRSNVERAAAVVEAINIENRMVTLRSLARDATIVMEVDDEVRNLSQVKVGDRVVVEYIEAVAFDLKKGGGLDPSTSIALAAGRAELGEKPAGAVGNSIQIIATVLAIDPDEPSATLKGPDGNVVEVVVKHPEKLTDVDVGDQVVITYTRAVAVGVEPSPIQ